MENQTQSKRDGKIFRYMILAVFVAAFVGFCGAYYYTMTTVVKRAFEEIASLRAENLALKAEIQSLRSPNPAEEAGRVLGRLLILNEDWVVGKPGYLEVKVGQRTYQFQDGENYKISQPAPGGGELIIDQRVKR